MTLEVIDAAQPAALPDADSGVTQPATIISEASNTSNSSLSHASHSHIAQASSLVWLLVKS